MRLEPCGHLICHICLHSWLDSGRTDCPFCREEIKDSEQVVIDPFGDRVLKDDSKKDKDIGKRDPLAPNFLVPQVKGRSAHSELPPPPSYPNATDGDGETLDAAYFLAGPPSDNEGGDHEVRCVCLEGGWLLGIGSSKG